MNLEIDPKTINNNKLILDVCKWMFGDAIQLHDFIEAVVVSKLSSNMKTYLV